MKIQIYIAFKLFLILCAASAVRLALAEVKSNISSVGDSAQIIDHTLRGYDLKSLSDSISNKTDIVVGGLLTDGETLMIKGMKVEVEKKTCCVPSAGGGLTPLDKNLLGRQYLLKFQGTGGVVFLWTEFDSVYNTLKFTDLTCTLSSSMPAFMIRQKLRANQSGLGDFQIELRDGGGVLLFVRGGIVVDVRNKDIGIAKAIDELILARTKECLNDRIDEGDSGSNRAKDRLR